MYDVYNIRRIRGNKMIYSKETNINDFDAWSGAVDTMNTVREANKIEDLESLLDEVFFDKVPTETDINDFLWFDTDYIYESLGIEEE